MMVDIVYIRKELIRAWRTTVEAVAAERKFLGRVTLPPFDPENNFALKMIENNWPMYCAIAGEEVVGWADITPSDIPECAHRGTFGMGVSAQHRGKGIGSRLLEACLAHARKINLAKVELTVYTNNAAAIALYRKYGFTEVGVRRDYRRLDGITYDELLMDLFLD
ncbi:MAG: GNAT family N-acetyltransferase [Alphaproteobacteria bacterium]